MARGLPLNVIATVQSPKASSTRRLYAYKRQSFELWCHDKGLVTFDCSVRDILMFLQELFEQGRAFSTLNVYMATILECHVGID